MPLRSSRSLPIVVGILSVLLLTGIPAFGVSTLESNCGVLAPINNFQNWFTLNCMFADGTTLTGAVHEIVTDSVDYIILTSNPATGVAATITAPAGAATNGSFTLSNRYNFLGFGTERAGLFGFWNTPLPGMIGGPATLDLTVTGTTFNNNSAYASWVGGGFGPLPFNQQDLHYGYYEATNGRLSGTFTYSLGAGETFVFPSSGEIEAKVPEPASLLLVFLGLTTMFKIRRR